jgi:hypothetical protein
MKILVKLLLATCLGLVNGCSPGGAGEISCAGAEEANKPVKEDESRILQVRKLDIMSDYLSLDYLVHNPFDHDIWVCYDLDVGSKNRVSERDAATRIAGGTLWIRLHEHLEWDFFGDPVVARYRRVPSGNSVSENLLLPVPVTNDSPVYAYGHRNDVRAFAHRVVFELGYFTEDLPSLLSQWGDANSVLISRPWAQLDLEQIAEATIADVNVPVMAQPEAH